MAAKYEKNPRTVARVREKMEEYIKRAELLKEAIANRAPKKQASAAAASSGAKDTRDDDDDNGERNKLRGGLESAVLMEKPNVKVWGGKGR
jgi:vacuolar protein-sorting-associated protein 4